MRNQIYQNGFWLLVGMFIGAISMSATKPKTVENTIRVEMVKDSIVVKDTVFKKIVSERKVLNESNLKKELEKHNIPHANIVLAQAKLESGNFTSKLTKTHQNIFGLKRGNSYRKYDHWTECVKDYKKLISSKYKGGCYYAFLNRIGYATNPNYTKLLKGLA